MLLLQQQRPSRAKHLTRYQASHRSVQSDNTVFIEDPSVDAIIRYRWIQNESGRKLLGPLLLPKKKEKNLWSAVCANRRYETVVTVIKDMSFRYLAPLMPTTKLSHAIFRSFCSQNKTRSPKSNKQATMAPSSSSEHPDVSTSLAGIPLSSCIYNASGPRSGTAAALQKIAQSKAGAVLSKSATVDSQTGNPLPRTWHAPDGLASLNSEGLPNNGIAYYISASTIAEAMGECSDNNKKPYMVSLSGKTLADNLQMLQRIATSPTRSKISAIELNLACPNVIGKPIIGFDFEQMDEILTAVAQVYNDNNNDNNNHQLPPLGVKLPPYLDFQHFALAADILNKHKDLVRYIASINTIGNSLAIDVYSEAPYISSNSGFAGLSGPAVKYTALANVRKFRSLLDASIDVVGVGGVQSGQDVFELILAGATAVQVATCHWIEGPKCFDRICQELQEIMVEKKYTKIEDFKGKLKEWSKEGANLSRLRKKEADTTLKEAQPTATTTSVTASTAAELTFYKTLCGVLVILVAVLCADWRSSIKLLPTE